MTDGLADAKGLSGEQHRGLAEALGPRYRPAAEPFRMAGCTLEGWVEPGSAEQLGAALAELSKWRLPVVIAGGRTRIEQGNPARGARLALSTRGLASIDEFDVAEGVVHAGAGVRLADLAELVSAEGWQLPLDPPGEDATLGGVLAAAATGPRRLGFGPPRDSVLGVDAVMASGAITRCGGRVVKNVSGYDLAKLYIGSYGTLAVLTGAWLHLKPSPLAERCLVVRLPEGDDAQVFALEAARLGSARAAVLVDAKLARSAPALAPHVGDANGWLLVCELAGEPVTCERDARRLLERADGDEVEAGVLRATRDLPTMAMHGALRARLQVTPASVPDVCRQLAALGARLILQPVPGMVHACFEQSGDDRWIAQLSAVREIRRVHAGELIIETRPEGAVPLPDVFFGEMGKPDVLPLMQSIKARFDPDGILNPGRFVGGI